MKNSRKYSYAHLGKPPIVVNPRMSLRSPMPARLPPFFQCHTCAHVYITSIEPRGDSDSKGSLRRNDLDHRRVRP